MSFLLINKTLRLNSLKTRTAINVKISVLFFGAEAIIYLLLYNLYDFTFKQWHDFKREYNLHESSYFSISIPEWWKFIIEENFENATNLIINDHHLVKGSRVITLDRLTSTGIYSILISKAQNKPSSNIYLENLYNDYNTDWTVNFTLPCLVTYNNCMRSFQYKILNNVLFLNKKLHTFGIKPSSLCSFSNLYNETPFHKYYECNNVTFIYYECNKSNGFKVL